MSDKAKPLDQSPLKILGADEGEVWIGFEIDTPSGFNDDHYRAIAERLVDLVHRLNIGEWLGQSSGAGQLDISFDVSNVRTAVKQLRALIPKHFPRQPFWVSDGYETIFDRAAALDD
jgi:hypothetical protein